MPRKAKVAQSIMFEARDAERHTVAWGPVGGEWMLEKSSYGRIRGYKNLVSALSELERVSGIPANNFQVSPNPYL